MFFSLASHPFPASTLRWTAEGEFLLGGLICRYFDMDTKFPFPEQGLKLSLVEIPITALPLQAPFVPFVLGYAHFILILENSNVV